MTASWFTPVSVEPPLLVVAISRESYTIELIRKNKEFTLNVVGSKHLDIVFKAGSVSGRRVDKWTLLGLREYKSKYISAPGIDGSYAIYECCVKEIVETGECDLVLAEVLGINVLRELHIRYGWDLKKADILLHISGRVFTVPGRILYAKNTS